MIRSLRQALTPPDPSFDPRAARRLQRFAQSLPANARVLDVGCGDRLGLPGAVGVDIEPCAAAACRADAQRLPFRDAAFDAVVSFAALEHIPDPRRVVAEMLRVLKPGGRVYLVVPFLQGYHPPLGADSDYWRFTETGLRRLCAGFECEESGVATGPMSALAWVLREIAAAPLFNRRLLVKPVRFAAGWLTAAVKLLDAAAVYFPGAHRVASSFYFIGVKPAEACSTSARPPAPSACG